MSQFCLILNKHQEIPIKPIDFFARLLLPLNLNDGEAGVLRVPNAGESCTPVVADKNMNMETGQKHRVQQLTSSL